MNDDALFVRSYEFSVRVGVYEEEKTQEQKVSLDLSLVTDLQAAGVSDDITQTIDYIAIIDTIHKVAKQKHYELLEALAESIAQALLATFPIKSVSVSLHKPNIIQSGSAIGIRIQRARK